MHLINARSVEYIKLMTRKFLYGIFGRGNFIFNKVYTVLQRPRCDTDSSPPSSAEVKNRVELYLYSP